MDFKENLPSSVGMCVYFTIMAANNCFSFSMPRKVPQKRQFANI